MEEHRKMNQNKKPKIKNFQQQQKTDASSGLIVCREHYCVSIVGFEEMEIPRKESVVKKVPVVKDNIKTEEIRITHLMVKVIIY